MVCLSSLGSDTTPLKLGKQSWHAEVDQDLIDTKIFAPLNKYPRTIPSYVQSLYKFKNYINYPNRFCFASQVAYSKNLKTNQTLKN